MRVLATAPVPIDPPDTATALRTVSRLVSEHSDPNGHEAVELALASRRRRFLDDFARMLPAAATGFASFANGEQQTASEVLSSQWGAGAYRGTPELPLDQLVRSLEELVAEHAAEGPTFTLRIRGLRWQGASEDAACELTVLTLRSSKPLAPIVRAGLTVSASDARDPAIKKLLTAIRKQTELAFEVESIGPEPGEEMTPQQHAIVTACLREAISRTSAKLRDTLSTLSPLPHLHRDASRAIDERIQAVANQRGERVNADRHFKQLMRQRPGFRARAATEALAFTRPLTDRLELAVTFDKVHQWGLGKSFHVLVGVVDRHVETKHVRRLTEEDLMAVFGNWPSNQLAHTWAYASADELEAALEGIGRVLDAVLPVLEHELRVLLDPLPREMPPSIHQQSVTD